MADNYSRLEEAMRRKAQERDAVIADLTEQKMSFTDKLKERTAYHQKTMDAGGVDYVTAMQGSNGVHANPQTLGSIYNSLLASSREQLDPIQKYLKETSDSLNKVKTDNTEIKDLMDLIGLQQTDSQISLGAAEKGYKIDPETGKVIVSDGAIANPWQEVQAQGGNDILKSVPVSKQEEMARMILKTYGSVENFRKNADMKTLLELNPDLAKADAATQAIMAGIAPIEAMFPEGTKSDLSPRSRTGSVVSKTWQPLKTKDQKDAESFITQYESAQVKELSGVAVSPAEMERMRGYLPNKNDDESAVALKVQNIKKAVQMNMAIRELAAREGLTLTQAETKYKPQLLVQFGLDAGNSAPTAGPSPSLDATDEDLINKYKGK